MVSKNKVSELFLNFLVVFLVSYFGVAYFRRWSIRRKMLDIPNDRSSHKIPTPRGGGIVIVLVTLIVYSIKSFYGSSSFNTWFFVGAALIAVISWFDDLFSISFIWRLMAHSVAALLIIFGVGYFQIIEVPLVGVLNLGVGGAVLTYLWIVWMTNAYNFMDGIDGIAAIQAIIGGLGWFCVGSILGLDTISGFSLIMAAASLGFLLHNWQPAKIFMGDVGSAYIGFCFAVLPLMDKQNAENYRQFFPWFAVLLVWMFFFDTVYTFISRLTRREKVWQAHRKHLYQQLVIKGLSHQSVTGLYGILTLINAVTAGILLYFGKFDPQYAMALCMCQAVFVIFLVKFTVEKDGSVNK